MKETYTITGNEEEQCWFLRKNETGDVERCTTEEMLVRIKQLALYGLDFKATIEVVF